MKLKLKTFFLAIGLITVSAIIMLFPLSMRSDAPGPEFVNDLIAGREEAVMAKLSTNFREVISAECPHGRATECVQSLILADWGELREIHFVIGSGRDNSTLYYAFWSNLSRPVSIVLITSEENGKEVVVGWRGFIVSEGEDSDSQLLHGERRDNQQSEIGIVE